MEFKTDDGYKITYGTRIKYTGDMANVEGWFNVTKIEPTQNWGPRITITETNKEREMVLSVCSFNSGPGRRFKPAELVKKEWEEVYAKFERSTK